MLKRKKFSSPELGPNIPTCGASTHFGPTGCPGVEQSTAGMDPWGSTIWSWLLPKWTIHFGPNMVQSILLTQVIHLEQNIVEQSTSPASQNEIPKTPHLSQESETWVNLIIHICYGPFFAWYIPAMDGPQQSYISHGEYVYRMIIIIIGNPSVGHDWP